MHDPRVIKNEEIVFHPCVIQGNIILNVDQLVNDTFWDFFSIPEKDLVGAFAVSIQALPARMRHVRKMSQQTIGECRCTTH